MREIRRERKEAAGANAVEGTPGPSGLLYSTRLGTEHMYCTVLDWTGLRRAVPVDGFGTAVSGQ